MDITDVIREQILKLKNDNTVGNKQFRIQRLQQLIDDSEGLNKIKADSINNDTTIEHEIGKL